VLDYQLIELFLPIINAGLIARGYSNVIVTSSYQPTTQGVNTSATVYYYKVGDYRYGWVKREDVWNPINSVMTYSEIQQYETTFQISALVISDPTNISYTASDLVNVVASIMQSRDTINTLEANGVGIYRVTNILNVPFIDDKDRYEFIPSFNFTLTHKQVNITTDPIVTPTELDIFPI